MEQQQQPLENREVRGLTFKNVLMIICCTATIVSSVIGSYYFLSKQIHDTNTKVELFNEKYNGDGKYNDLKFRTIEAALRLVEIKVDNLQVGGN